MENHVQRFEEFLREFQPSRPQALPEAAVANRSNWQRLAAAAIVTIACGSGFWFANSRHAQPLSTTSEQPMAGTVPVMLIDRASSAVLLERLALEHPDKFDAALSQASQSVLPRFDGPSSSLGLLAKD